MKFKHLGYEFELDYFGINNERCHVTMIKSGWWCGMQDTPISKSQIIADAEKCILQYENYLNENNRYQLQGTKSAFTYKGYEFKCYQDSMTNVIVKMIKKRRLLCDKVITKKKVFLANWHSVTNKEILKCAGELIAIVNDDTEIEIIE